MDYVGAVLTSTGPLKEFWPSISKCFNYHKVLDKNRTTLQEKMEKLKCREQDVNTELQNAQYHQKKARKEVENWLKQVQNIKDDVQGMEQEVDKGKCFSRLGSLRRLEENIEKLDKLLDWGEFHQGILIDAPRDGGKALLTTELIGETTAKRNLEKIWTSLEKGDVHSIGVWGMGGIGKTTIVTHIHNRLLENEDTFGLVYWVTISKDSNIHKLQDAIAGKINLDLSREQDKKIRSALLFEELQKKPKFVLIFDDVWEVYAPRDVGIPIGFDRGKLIMTTRSREVCQRMGCKEIIKLESLPNEEAWELFNETLERYDALGPKEEKIAKDIVKECAGLPLAIVTTARSLSVVYDIAEWRNALNELREHVKGHTIDMENHVFKILEFSCDRLNDDKIRECLLYCALFPEDFYIRRISLIRYWIVEGLIEEMGSRQAECDRGHAILNKLENVCLLERCWDGKGVKMHDVIRDMAINMTKKNSQFMVKTGKFEDLLSEMVWSNNLERVSFFNNRLSSLMFEPKCPKLCTLFLQSMGPLPEGLLNSFFMHMIGLRVLDLSCTSIPSLPDSLYNLVNLQGLFLRGCRELKHAGSLAKLKKLRELDLSDNNMETLPDGIEKLVHLKYFSWTSTHSREELHPHSNPISYLVPNLVYLQYLNFQDERFGGVGVEELSWLAKLEVLSIDFSSLGNFNSYMRTQHYRRLTRYHVRLNVMEIEYHEKVIGVANRFSKEVGVSGFKWNGGKDKGDHQLVLPTNLKVLYFEGCHLPISLLDVSSSLKMTPNLKECWMRCCKGIEYLWWADDCVASLNKLSLTELPSLRVLFKLRPTHTVSCSSLKHLDVSDCDNLKYLFTPQLVKYHLQNLQAICVSRCSQVEDVIVATEEVEEENINEMNDLILHFPNLQWLWLDDLPELKSIWTGTISCNSLKAFKVIECPKLRRLPFPEHMRDGGGRRAPTPPLDQIEEWWDGVERDAHLHGKSHFQPTSIWESEFWVHDVMLYRRHHFWKDIEELEVD